MTAGALLLSGCATPQFPHSTSAPLPRNAVPQYAANVRVVSTGHRLECVPYARRLSRIDLHGDAWTWWSAARGRYKRGHAPEKGAVLVLKRQGHSLGHLAVVTRIVSDRVILADHANWLNRGRVYQSTPIRDVSRRGDWSAVRVWYPPGNRWGASAYAAYGFIYGPRTNSGRIASSAPPSSD